ncbi:MAG: hypothetical protein ACI4JG_09815 [Acutalibacteraceae bacterium]
MNKKTALKKKIIQATAHRKTGLTADKIFCDIATVVNGTNINKNVKIELYFGLRFIQRNKV